MSHAHAFDHHVHIQACAQGRAQALHALFQHESSSMLALADAWLADEARARQAVTDTFVMVWKHASHYPAQPGQARAWLYSILRHRLKYEPHDYSQTDPVRWHSLPELDAAALVALTPADKRVLQAAYCLGLNTQALARLAPQGSPAGLRQALATLVQHHGLASPALAAADQQALAAYVLGVADESARRYAEGLLQSRPAAAQHVLHWEDVCLAFVDALAPAPAAQPLLATICRQLQLPMPATMPLRPEAPRTRQPQVSEEPKTERPRTEPGLSSPTPAAVARKPAAADHQAQSSEAPSPLLRMPSSDAAAEPSTATQAQRPSSPKATETPAAAARAEAARVEAQNAATTAQAPRLTPQPQHPAAETEAHTQARKARRQRPALLPWVGGAAVVLALGVAASQWLSALAQPDVPAAPPRPHVQQVAILQAPGSTSTPGWLLTQDSNLQVNLKPLVDVEVRSTEAVYLWTQSATDPAPRLLSRVMPDASLRLAPEQIGPIGPGQVFEMTLEPIRETLPAEPEGAVLFIGRAVGLEETAPPAQSRATTSPNPARH